MIELKLNDWVLNLLGNLNFSISDFKEVGLNAENTSLLSEDIYKNSKQILEKFQKEDGTFDEQSFHNFYENAQLTYNMLANDTFLNNMYLEQAVFGKDNILAPREQRRSFDQTVKYAKLPNPDRTITGLVRIGETASPTKSRSEIALTQKVLTNPTEVYDESGNPDWSKAIWHDSPNDSWFTDFFDTRVLAQWESDGEHTDPITGKTVKHQKGQAKLNEEGTYYYENLDGRDVYGKLVLNKMNTLTVDGSSWNKYDFFDSDDLEQKSITGSVLKNAALVGSMFIPYVGPWIAGLSVASLLIGLSGTLGKMLTGSDSPTFSALEGWAKSVNRLTAKSQYAIENTWCWENFINLVGDIAGQLKELRFLFEFAPALIKGNKTLGWNGISTSKQKTLELARTKYYDDLLNTKFTNMQAARLLAGKAITETELGAFTTAKQATQLMGRGDVEKFMKSYQHIGEILSKGYMTAITVGDTYGEAKLANASDIEATFLTLGYAAMEAALLNSEIGEWILPELKASGLKNKTIVKALTEVPDSMRLTSKLLAELGKKATAKYWFIKGKEIAEEVMKKGKGLVGSMVSGGLGESLEETSEELLADFTKSCFNTLQWLQGDEGRMDAWENMTDRYLMSFLGGALGGSLTAAGTNLKIATTAMNSEQARQEMIYMLRENKKDELFKALDKVTIANPYLQFSFDELSDGTLAFKPADSKTSNMDKDIKKAFVQQVNLLDNIIKAEGLKITDERFLDAQTFKDIRLANLQYATVSGLYLLDFNSLVSNIVQTLTEINNLTQNRKDSDKLTPDEETHLKSLTLKLNDLRNKALSYINGDLAMDYTSLALFELTPIVRSHFSTMFFKDYVEKKYHQKLENVSESDLKKYREEFDVWKNTESKNDIVTKGRIYLDLAKNSKEFIQEFAKNYDTVRKNKTLLDLIKNRLKQQTVLNLGIEDNLVDDTQIDLDKWLDTFTKIEYNEGISTILALVSNKGKKQIQDSIKQIQEQSINLEKSEQEDLQRLLEDLINVELLYNLDTYFDEFIKTGSINPEIKNLLIKGVNGLKTYLTTLISGVNALNIPTLISKLQGMFINVDENTTLDLFLEEDPYLLAEVSDDLEYVVNGFKDIFKILGKSNTSIKLKDIIDLQEELKQLNSKLDYKISEINNISYTDSIQFILKFILANSDSNLDIANLLETINSIIHDNLLDLSQVNLSEVIGQIDEAIEVIGWLLGLVIGALSDSDANLTNLIGYNITLNEIANKHNVTDWDELPTISTQDSNIINQDLLLVKNKLIHAKNIHAINLGKKLSLLNRVATNKNYITYNRLRKFIVNIDDSWAEKLELEDALNKAELLKKYAENRQQVSEPERKAMEKEMLKIDDAVYNFFNNEKNKEKILKEELYTIFEKGFDLYNDTELLINELTEILEDRNFLFYLATRATIKKSAFNNELRQIIDPKAGLAPIPTLQEAVFHNIAEVINGDLITTFIEAYKTALNKNWGGLSKDAKKDILVNIYKMDSLNLQKIIDSDVLVNIDKFPKFTNIYLTEGIPGAGKSKAVDYYTVLILKKFHGDILQNAWLVNNTKRNAEKLETSLDVKFKKLFDRIDFMKSIYSNYNTKRQQDKKGVYIYSESEWTKTSEGEIVYKGVSDDISDVPSLIIIDEISHYDQADLEIINDFAKKYGITVLTSGDFLQSTTQAKYVTKEGVDVILTPTRGLFKHSPKLGVSMRSNNSQMDKTITSFLASTENHTIDTYYYESNEGFNGVKQVFHNDTSEIERILELMINTAKIDEKTGEKEKIGFIYYDEDSPILKLINSKYSDKFEKFTGTAAQGLEGQYYVIDFFGSEETDKFALKQDLYTGVSRAEQGALVIYTRGNAAFQQLIQHQETSTIKSGYDDNHIKSYAISAKNLLDEMSEGSELLPQANRKKLSKPIEVSPIVEPTVIVAEDTSDTVEIINGTWSDSNLVKDITYKSEKYATDGTKVGKYIAKNKIELLENDPVIETILNIYNLQTSEPELNHVNEVSETTIGEAVHNLNSTRTDITPVLENPAGSIDFTYLFHTHNTLELGLNVNSNNKLKFLDSDLKRYKHRIDSALGLMKIYELDWTNPTLDADFYIGKLVELRNGLFNIQDKTVLINYLRSVLGSNISNLEFGLISNPNISKNSKEKWGYQNQSGKYGILDKHLDEKTIYNDVNPETNRKTISAVITLENGKRLTLPLFVLGNLETYTRNPKNAISLLLKTVYDRVDGKNHPYEFHEAVLNDPILKNVPEIYNLATLFIFTNGAYFKIEDSSWTPAKNLRNLGMLVNTNAVSGGKYPYDGQNSFTPINKFLKRKGYHFSSQIYTTLNKVNDGKGALIEFSKKGHAFILVTQDPDLKTDAKMQALYEKQLKDPNEPKKVTLIYVMPPKVPIKTYLKNLYDLVNEKDNRDKIKRLGSHLTSYYIWKSLIDKLDNPIFSTIDLKTKEKLKDEINRLKEIEEKHGTLDVLNELASTTLWDGNTSKSLQSLQNHLNYLLLSIFMSFDNNEIIQENLDSLTDVIESTGLDGIFYSPKFKDKEQQRGRLLIPLLSDLDLNGNSTYTIDGLDFSINAKIDTNLFSMNSEFGKIIESFVNKIKPADGKHPRSWSSDTDEFVSGALQVTVTDDLITIPLEDNGLDIKELKISITDHTVSINDKLVLISKEEVKNIKIKSKNDLKILLENSVPKAILDGRLKNLIDSLYDKQIFYLLLGNLQFMLVALDLQLKDLLNVVNGNLTNFKNSIAFIKNNKIIVKTFTDEELKRVGLSEGISLEPFNFNENGEIETTYNGVIININKETEEISLFKEPTSENVISNLNNTTIESDENIISDWDNMTFDSDEFKKLMKKFDIQDEVEELIAFYGYTNIQDIKGYDEFIDLLKDVQDPDKQIESLITYLENEDNDQCSINMIK